MSPGTLPDEFLLVSSAEVKQPILKRLCTKSTTSDMSGVLNIEAVCSIMSGSIQACPRESAGWSVTISFTCVMSAEGRGESDHRHPEERGFTRLIKKLNFSKMCYVNIP